MAPTNIYRCSWATTRFDRAGKWFATAAASSCLPIFWYPRGWKNDHCATFAKGLNCEVGISQNPCGQCVNCLEIAHGRFVDLIEIDAASRTKVEDTRELLDNVQYAPARGRFKVYLIDEVHMLSRHSFNALLKTLEEPPEHVKFLLATTDPQKLPITVLSRCLQFHLRTLDIDQISSQLERILAAEQISRINEPAN